MSLPMSPSPYLRPFRRAGILYFDNPLVGTHQRFSPLAEAALVALWQPQPIRALESLADQSPEALGDAFLELSEAGALFPDERAAHAALAQVRDQALKTLPFVDQIEVSGLCPMRCGFCPRGQPGRIQRPSGLMDLDLYRKLLDQLPPGQARYRPLELHHLGESLLHPELATFVQEATDRGLPTELSVNPALLTPERADALLEAGVFRLVISLDGLDDETSMALRGPLAKASVAFANLEHLDRRLNEMSKAPQVVLQMIDLARNRHQHAAFLERFGGLTTMRAYIKPLDGDDPDTGHPSDTPVSFLCLYPFRSVVVLWDGRVVPCCRDDDAHLVLGDLNRQTLAEIWKSPAALTLRSAHITERFPKGHLCATCPWQRKAFAETWQRRRPETAPEDPLVW